MINSKYHYKFYMWGRSLSTIVQSTAAVHAPTLPECFLFEVGVGALFAPNRKRLLLFAWTLSRNAFYLAAIAGAQRKIAQPHQVYFGASPRFEH